MKKLFVLSMMLLNVLFLNAQSASLEGYVYEEGNRGYLNTTKVVATEVGKIRSAAEAFTDVNGYFKMELEAAKTYELKYTKDFFKEAKKTLTTTEGKNFTKMPMKREPGYSFEITLADKRDDVSTPTDGIKNTLIEVYNNTTGKPELVIENHPDPHFDVHLNKGNHYTILVRKEGYFAKRMEVNVAVHGCILCFEGVGTVRPGVTDNLTEGNENGVLLANVEMDKLYEGKTVEIQNLYYDLGKSDIRPDAATELDKIVKLMKYNPNIRVELGSHTDSRGNNDFNMKLSQARAKSAVDYLIEAGNLDPYRIQSRGYGELVLTNECADGVSCSEEQHQKNRRTELKVLGVEKELRFQPLADMKQMEQFEQMVINGGSMGQSVSAEEYARIQEQEAKTKAKVDEMRKALGGEEQVEAEEVQQEAPVQTEDRVTVIDVPVERAPETPTTTDFVPVTKEVKNLEEAPSVPLTPPSEKVPKENFKMEIYEKSLNSTPPIIVEVNDDVPITYEDTTNTGLLNGVKIALLETDLEIPETHPMFTDFNISTFSVGDKTLYMIDEKDMTIEKAKDMMSNDLMLLSYPKAKIVEFKDGKLMR